MLHTAAARALGIDVAYVPINCRDDAHFCEVVDALRCIDALGANVTIPYKHVATRVADSSTERARAIGAVNTLVFERGGVVGDNTDGAGLLAVLNAIPAARFERVQILGAGGAARAAAWALAAKSATEITVCARRMEAARSVAKDFGARASVLAPMAGVTLVVSTLPGTVELAQSALFDWVDRTSSPFVCDLAYGGIDHLSPLAARAEAAGLAAIDGRTMLVEQAALSFARWTGGELSAIRAAMTAALNDAA